METEVKTSWRTADQTPKPMPLELELHELLDTMGILHQAIGQEFGAMINVRDPEVLRETRNSLFSHLDTVNKIVKTVRAWKDTVDAALKTRTYTMEITSPAQPAAPQADADTAPASPPPTPAAPARRRPSSRAKSKVRSRR